MRVHRLSWLLLAAILAVVPSSGTGRPAAGSAPAPLPRPAKAERELHVVGIYEGFTKTDRTIHGGKALVTVNRPGKRVTLVLTSNDSVTWEVTTGPGTHLEKVLLGGNRRHAVKGVSEKVEVTEAWRGGQTPLIPHYTYRPDSVEFRAVVEAASRATGQKVASFQTKYRAEEPFVIDRVVDDPRLSADWPTPTPLADLPVLKFKAMHFTPGRYGHETQVAYGDFTLNGPKADALKPMPHGVWRMTYDPDGKKFYGVAEAGNAIVDVDMERRTVKKLDLGLDVPRLNTPTDLTVDTKRKRLLLCATGCLYAYSTATGKWSILTDGFRVVTMAYHPGEDALYGVQVEHEGATVLVKFNPEGAVLKRTTLEGPIVPGSVPSGPGITGIQLVHVDGRLVLLTWPGGHHLFASEGRIPLKKYIYLVDPKSGKVQVSYKDPPGAAEEKGIALERDFAIKAGEVRTFNVDGPEKDQHLTVSVRSEGAPIDAYLVPREDGRNAEAAMAGGKPPAGFVAAARGVEEVSFSITIRAGKGMSLLVGNAPKASAASVRMTGR